MGNSWTEIHFHIVYSTKHRAPLILPEWEPRLHAFMGGIVRDIGAVACEINGMSEHVHLLVRCPPDLALATLVREVKSRSSKWIHQSIKGGESFDWQEGYGGFAVSSSVVPAVAEYVRNQKPHHARLTFQEEWALFMRRLRRPEP